MGKNTYTGALLLAAASALTAITAEAQIPDGYYSSLKGKKGAELKTAVHEIIKKANTLEYGKGKGHTWEGFYYTDRTSDNKVIDRYSNDIREFPGSPGSVPQGMNIEHSFPKSWWGGAENQAYHDLYNLMPSEQNINSRKSNYPMGEVTTVKHDNGCTKIGTGHNSYQLWEPADKWKGDFARGYMYMATAYQNLTWKGTQALQILQQGSYPTLQEWAYTLYLQWAKTDTVDKTETERNNAVAEIQGNRNPFVDFPNLMEYIWGDSISYEFDPETTVRTSEYENGGGVQPSDATIYEAEFTSSTGGCVTENISVPQGGFDVWTRDSKYGWKGTGFSNDTKYAAEASLVTPEIDLTGYGNATLTFSHAANHFAKPENVLAVEVRCDGKTTTLSGINWPEGNNWTFISSGEIALDGFSGKRISIAFHYRSTSAEAGTWEIMSMSVKAQKTDTGIDNAATVSGKPDMSRPYETFTVDGRKTDKAGGKGILIIRQDGKTWKTTRK